MHMNKFVFNAKTRSRITPTSHEFIDKPKVTIMWMKKTDLIYLRTPENFVGKSLVK